MRKLMNKTARYTTLILGSLLFANVNIKGQKAPALTAPAAPFKKPEYSVKLIKPQAKIVGREIIFGNKKLMIAPSGEIVIMSDSRKLCKLYFYVKTQWSQWLTNKARGKVPAKWKHGYVGIDQSFYDKAQKQFIIKGSFPLNKKFAETPIVGHFIETITLLDNGKVNIDLEHIIAEKDKKLFLGGCIFLTCSNLENFSIKGTKYTFEEKTKNFSAPCVIHFAANDAIKNFNINVTSSAGIRATKRRNTEDFRIYPRRTNKISFSLDLGKVPAKNLSTGKRTYSGVDFKKTDDFEVTNYFICRNLMQNPSFEQGLMYCLTKNHFDTFLGTAGIKVDDTNALFGKHSLKVNLYERRYKIILAPIPVETGKYIFSFYVKGDGSENQNITSNIINVDHKRLASKSKVKISKKWNRISIPLEITKATAVSCILNAGGNKGNCIYIDGVQLEKGDKLTAFTPPPVEGILLTSKDDNFLSPEDKIDAGLRIFSDEPETSGKVKVTVKDFFGVNRFEENYRFKTNKDKLAFIKLPFNDKFTRGIFVVKADYTLDNGQKLNNFFRFSIMSNLENKHKLKAMFANNYNGTHKRDASPGVEKYLKRCRNIGVGGDAHAGRISEALSKLFKKYGIEIIDSNMSSYLEKDYKKVKDSHDRKFFAIYSDRSFRKGAKLYIKDFRLEGNAKLNDEYLKKFEATVIKVVKEYPWIPRWALGGEMNAKYPEWLKNDMGSFADLQIAFYKAVKKANPKIEVYNGTACNIYPEGGIKTTRQILKAIDGRIKYDALAIHAYLPSGPSSLEANMEAFFKMAGELGYKNTPTFYPEGMHYGPYEIPQWNIVSASWGAGSWDFGTLSYDMGWYEKMTAAWFARTWLICMKYMDRVISATSGACARTGSFHLDANLTPRAYQKIPNTLGRLLGNSNFVQDLSFATDTKCLIFEDENKRPVAAVWGKLEKVDQGLEDSPWAMAKFAYGDVEIFDLMETRRNFSKDNKGNIRFPVSTFPFFIRGKKGTMKQFCSALKSSKMVGGNLMPLKMTAKIVGRDSIDLILSNQISREVKGSIKVLGEKRSINIAPQKSLSLKVKLPKPLAADKITDIRIPVSIGENGNPNSLNKDFSFKGFLCHKTNTKIFIDGKDNDWKNIPKISLTNWTINKINKEKINYKGDFNGFFKVAWDKDYIYLMVHIKDDVFTHKAVKRTDQRWNNDSLQVFIDSKCDARSRKQRGYDKNDYDYAIFPNEDGKSSICFRYRSPDIQLTLGPDAPKDMTIAKNIPSSFQRTYDGYIYETAFPAKYLLPVNLERNYALGFCLFVNDRDNGKRTKQALTLTPSGTGAYRNPHLYPVMLLAD